jgi:hypothetical protein
MRRSYPYQTLIKKGICMYLGKDEARLTQSTVDIITMLVIITDMVIITSMRGIKDA